MWFYPIDWAVTGVWMQAWAGFAGAAAVVLVAKIGASTFLKERQLERKIAAADRLMAFVYKAKRAFPGIRNNGVIWAETAAAVERLKASQTDYDGWPEWKKERYQIAQTVLDRLQANKSLWTELFECLPYARAYFGAECEQQIDRVWRLYNWILSRANLFAKVSPDNPKSDEYEDIILEASEDDEINTTINSVVAYFEDKVLPTIASRPQDKSWWSMS